jgi:hypothetical protein
MKQPSFHSSLSISILSGKAPAPAFSCRDRKRRKRRAIQRTRMRSKRGGRTRKRIWRGSRKETLSVTQPGVAALVFQCGSQV